MNSAVAGKFISHRHSLSCSTDTGRNGRWLTETCGRQTAPRSGDEYANKHLQTMTGTQGSQL